MWALFLSIFVPIIFVLIQLLIWFFNSNALKKIKIYDSGIIIGKINIENKSVFMYENDFNFAVPHELIDTTIQDEWIPFNDFLSEFSPSDKKTILEVIEKTIKTKKEQTIKINKRNIKNKKYFLNFFIKPLNEEELVLNIEWKHNERKNNKNVIIKSLNQTKVIEDPSVYKGFVAFNLDVEIEDVEKKFLDKLNQLFKNKNINFFISRGMFIIPFFAKRFSSVDKDVKNLIRHIRGKGYRVGIDRYFYGSSFLLSKDVNSPKRLETIISALSYSVNLSIQNSKPFIHKDDVEFSRTQYFKVSEINKKFDYGIKNKKIKLIDFAVRNNQTDKKIINYTFPLIEGIEYDEQQFLVNNKFNKINLRNTFAELIAVDEVSTKPTLVDIDNEWLAQNYLRMKFKKAIYVINYPSIEETDTKTIIEEMEKRGFLFAIKVKFADQREISLIKSIKPKFIVIDEGLVRVQKPIRFVKLMTIKKLADLNGVRMLFENPSKKIDSIISTKLGIKYCYYI